MTERLVKLNAAQKKAVLHKTGPLLIIAGAGTGKTTVVTERIADLILKRGVSAEKILALTFTEKAAAEMEERVDQAMPYGYVDLWISTFHSFCEKILRQYGLEIGLPTDFKLLSKTDQWLLVRQNLGLFKLDYFQPRGNPTKFIHTLLDHFSRAKDEEVYPEDYLQFAENLAQNAEGAEVQIKLEEAKKYGEVAYAFNVYQQLLLDNKYLDFGDLINYTLKLLKTRKSVLKKITEQFEYILVDEFQDTNFAQYELIKLMAGERANLTVVGDDDQSIYKFRGASISNIMQFKKDYPKSAEVVLIENYRSTQNILDLSYNFIQLNNPNRLEVALSKGKKKLSKKLFAQGGSASGGKAKDDEKGIIEHLHFDTNEQEVAGIIEKIIKIKSTQKLRWSDFAILIRANDSALPFTSYLAKTQIPYQFFALKGLYTKPIIVDLVSFFKLLDNFHEGPAMHRVLSSRIVDIEPLDLMNIVQYANRKTISLYEAIRRVSEIFPLSNSAPSKINHLLRLIETHTDLAKNKHISEIFISFLQKSGILEKLLKQESIEDKLEMEYLQSFYKRIKKFEENCNNPVLKEFMAEMDMEFDSGDLGSLAKEVDAGPESLNIMTVHSSKGLEFEYVFLPNMVDKRFPTTERSEGIEMPLELIKDVVPEGDIHMQEERRLFYVAMTRAKKGLYFTSAQDYGGMRKKKISRFMMELKETNKSFELSGAMLADEKVFSAKSGSAFGGQPTKVIISQVKKVEMPPLPKYFSFSQLAAFSKCPYQYKLGFVYRIPVFGKGVFSYGRTMHKTLEEFYKQCIERSGGAPSDEKQVSMFEDKGVRELGGRGLGTLVSWEELEKLFTGSWIDEWYKNKDEKAEYWEKAKESLKIYYDKVKDQPLRTRFLERNFNIKLTKDNIEFFTVKGVMDRVDVMEDGSWQIVDYKTGTPKEKLEWEDKMQLLIYQIAAKEIFEAKVSKLTYYYLDENKELSFVGDDKEIEKLKSELIEIIEKIKSTNFAATPGWQCKFCDFRNICEFRD